MQLYMGIQITTLMTISEWLKATWVSLDAGGGRALSGSIHHPRQAGRVMPNPWTSPHNWTTSGTQTGASLIQAATTSICLLAQGLPPLIPIACHGRGLAFFVSLPNNSSCFQLVLNPPGNLILPRRRVLLYVISRQQLWPQHPERGSLCRTVAAGMNFPSPPCHLCQGCWEHAVGYACTQPAVIFAGSCGVLVPSPSLQATLRICTTIYFIIFYFAF